MTAAEMVIAMNVAYNLGVLWLMFRKNFHAKSKSTKPA